MTRPGEDVGGVGEADGAADALAAWLAGSVPWG